MTKIFYTDISDITLSDINLSLIRKERIDKANLINIELKKIQSLVGYLLLRYALKQFNIDINDYAFSYKDNKPFFEGLVYNFNITHSNNIVAVVISEKEVGIDCERIDVNRNFDLLKSYLFTAKETIEFDLLNDIEKCNYFYQKWVMKEAHFKNVGLGLTKKFNSIDNLNYQVIKIIDIRNISYYLCCSANKFEYEKIDFSLINWSI